MWFKNLRLFRLSKGFQHSPEELAALLEAHAFQPCGKLDPLRYGWVPPLGRHGSQLTHAANGNIMVCAKRQEKILPSTVIREHLEEKVNAITEEEGRHVSRKERDALKDEVIFDLLPKALAKSSLDYAYIAPADKLVVVNAASAKRAEELLSLLREATGPLSLVPFATSTPPVNGLTQWVKTTEVPSPFLCGEECELQAAKDGRVIRCKNQDLSAEEIIRHIDSGMLVTKLALNWNEAINFILDDQLAIKRIKFEDKLLEQASDKNPETAAEQFDVEFSVMAMELRQFIKDLSAALGGIADE